MVYYMITSQKVFISYYLLQISAVSLAFVKNMISDLLI